MNAHTHHGFLVSGGGHALVGLLLMLGNFSPSSRVAIEKPVGPLEMVTWPGMGPGAKGDEAQSLARDRVVFQPPVLRLPATTPVTERENEMPAAPVVPRAVRPASVANPTTPPTRGPKTVSPPRPTREVTPSVPRVNMEEIVNGLRPGPRSDQPGNDRGRGTMEGGAEALATYHQLIKQRVRAAFEPPANIADGLVAGVAFRISGRGVLSEVRITKPSGDLAFDAAVLAAFARVRLPEKPDGRAEELELAFRTEDLGAR